MYADPSPKKEARGQTRASPCILLLIRPTRSGDLCLGAEGLTAFVKERAVFELDLVGVEERSHFHILAELVEFHFVNRRRSAPEAANDADFPALEGELGDASGKADEIVDVYLPHE